MVRPASPITPAHGRLWRQVERRWNQLRPLNDEKYRDAVKSAAARAGAGPAPVAGAESGERLALHFALAAEALRRGTGTEPGLTHVAAAGALLDGAIVDMAAGDGKPAAALLAIYQRRREGRRAHLLTATAEGAAQVALDLAPALRLLGMATGVATGEGLFEVEAGPPPQLVEWSDRPADRRAIYEQPDLLVAEFARLAGDVLENRAATRAGDRVNFPFDFAVLADADRLLLDEGRRPFLRAIPTERLAAEVGALAPMVEELFEHAVHYVSSPGGHVAVTAEGVRRALEELEAAGLSREPPPRGLLRLLERLAAAAHNLRAGRDLVPGPDPDHPGRERAVFIDAASGVAVPGELPRDGPAQVAARRCETFPPHEASGLIRARDQVTAHALLAAYQSWAGYSGAAANVAGALKRLYGKRVVSFAPLQPVVRGPAAEYLAPTRREALIAVADYLEELQRAAPGEHRPVLVRLPSAGEANALSRRLDEQGVSHAAVLPSLASGGPRDLAALGAASPGTVILGTPLLDRGLDLALSPEAVARGGLLVISLGHGDIPRADALLCARCGQRGEPGKTLFVSTLEDDLLRDAGLAAELEQRFQSVHVTESPGGGRTVELDAAFSAKVRAAQKRIEKAIETRAASTILFGAVVEAQRRRALPAREAILTAPRGQVVDVAARVLGLHLDRVAGEHPLWRYGRFGRRRMALLAARLAPVAVAWWDQKAVEKLAGKHWPEMRDGLLELFKNRVSETAALHDRAGEEELRRRMLAAFDDLWAAHLARLSRLWRRAAITLAEGEDHAAKVLAAAERAAPRFFADFENAALRALPSRDEARRAISRGSRTRAEPA
ncbi:MAG: hypothetical protein HY719_03030 [Planctomycetes bacterium]|nr:hypothetical protein [Planctomycetota bacterium]